MVNTMAKKAGKKSLILKTYITMKTKLQLIVQAANKESIESFSVHALTCAA